MSAWKRRNILFTVILLLPAAALLGIVGVTAVDIVHIRNVRLADVLRELAIHLDRKQPESFPPPDNLKDIDPSKTLLFTFGASSLVLSDGWTFPDYLAMDHDDLQVVNLGIVGIDSYSVRLRVRQALDAVRPDIILLYYGHNDYNTAYQGFILPRYFDRFDTLLRLAFLFHREGEDMGVLESDDYYWFTRVTRPKLIQTFEKLGLLSINSADYAAVNRLILDHFIRNHKAIISMAAARGVPVVLVTPVGNVQAEPYGDLAVTEASYRMGMKAEGYEESMRDLFRARDSEIFTYDLRAKSPLVQYLRTFRSPNVYVLDLESRLKEARFGFGYNDFVDYFHFRDGSHRLIADIIYDFLAKHKLLSGRPKRR